MTTPNQAFRRGAGARLIEKAFAALGAVLLFAAASHAAEPPADKSIPIAKVKHSGPVDFEKEILPLLKNNCLACHSQTKPKGGLVLETPQTILKGGDNGPAVVPKKPRESLLLKAASHQDPELIMPPPDNKAAAAPLQPEELGLLQLWIEQGAKGEVRESTPIVWQPMPPGLSAIFAAALTRDGQFTACGRANQIFLYHLPTGRLAARLNDPKLQKSSSAGAAHRDTVNSLAFSPDGQWLASGGYREVKLWRRVKPLETVKLPGATGPVAASMDGKWIATSSTNGEVRLFNQAGKTVRTISPAGTRVGPLQFSVATNLLFVARSNLLEWFSVPDGQAVGRTETPAVITSLACVGPTQVAAACGDELIRLFDTATNGAAAVPKELKSTTPVAFVAASRVSSNELAEMVAGSADGAVRVWNLASGKVTAEVQPGPLTAIAMRPDGQRFATAGSNVARLWKIDSTNALGELKGDARASFLVSEQERELTFAKSEIDYRKSALKTAESNQVAAVARQKKAGETNAALEKIAGAKQTALTNATAAQREAEQAVEALDPEVKKLADAVVSAEKEHTNAVALAKAAKDGPDKSKFEKLTTDAESKSNALASAKAAFDQLPAETKSKHKQATEKLVSTTKAVADAEKDFKKAEQSHSAAEHEVQLADAAVNKAESGVAKAKTALAEAETTAQQADATVARAREELAAAAKPIQALAFSTDSLVVFTLESDGTVHARSAESGAPFETVSVPPGSGETLAALSATRFICAGPSAAAIWNLSPGWVLERVIGTGDTDSPLTGRVNALRFTADGQQLVTGGGEPTRGGEIKLWRISDGKLVREFPNVHSDSVFALDISADGKYLASGGADRFAKALELASGKILKTFEGHTHHVLGVAWKRDGRTLLTAGADNVAKVWDATTGERRKNIEGFGKEVTAGAFVGVSDEVVLVAGDGQVVLMKDKGDKVRSFTGASDYVNAAAVTPDGAIVIGGGADGVLRAWNGRDPLESTCRHASLSIL